MPTEGEEESSVQQPTGRLQERSNQCDQNHARKKNFDAKNVRTKLIQILLRPQIWISSMNFYAVSPIILLFWETWMALYFLVPLSKGSQILVGKKIGAALRSSEYIRHIISGSIGWHIWGQTHQSHMLPWPDLPSLPLKVFWKLNVKLPA